MKVQDGRFPENCLLIQGRCERCDVRGITAPVVVRVYLDGGRWRISVPAPRQGYRGSIAPQLRASRLGLEEDTPEYNGYVDGQRACVEDTRSRIAEGDDWLRAHLRWCAPRGNVWLQDDGPGRRTVTLYCPRCRKSRPAVRRRDLWARADHYARAGADGFLV